MEREVLERLPALVLWFDDHGCPVAANAAMRALSGWPPEAGAPGQMEEGCIHPADRETMLNAVTRLGRGEPTVYFQARCRDRLGRWRIISWGATCSDTCGMVVAVGRDISPMLAVEAQMRELAAAVEAAANGIVITDAEGRILWANPAFSAMTQYSGEEVIGQNPRILKSGRQDEAFYRVLWSTVVGGSVWRGTLVNRRKDGELYTEQMTITPLRGENGQISRFIAVKEDVTEMQRLREQLAHAAKMESIGRLAGGVAHDFNNLLQTISGFSELLIARLPETDEKRKDAEMIQAAARQAADLTRRLLAFSRRQIIEPRPLNLNEIAHSTVELSRRVVGEHIEVVENLDDATPSVVADPGQIQSVILNLIVNARDAMPDGGRIIVSTRPASFAKKEANELGGLPGRFACLSVADTGPGIPDEVRAHLFEPFFTTKGGGRGTGLGLATAYGIVEQHKGWIHVYSEKGYGACFRVYLPAAELSAQPLSPPPPPCEPSVPSARLILVVEDDENICHLAACSLIGHGYRIELARNVAEARKVWERRGMDVDLLFCDVVLPDGNGVDLVNEFLRRRPDVPVLMVSGYPDEYARWETIRERGFTFLQKPYPVAEMLRAVRLALGGRE